LALDPHLDLDVHPERVALQPDLLQQLSRARFQHLQPAPRAGRNAQVRLEHARVEGLHRADQLPRLRVAAKSASELPGPAV
jgi:hypothetical protein